MAAGRIENSDEVSRSQAKVSPLFEESDYASVPHRAELFGEAGRGLTKLFAPTPRKLSRMLRTLRRRLGWSQSDAASVLGVTKSSVVKWEAGVRRPCGTAGKLIFLLYTQLVGNQRKTINVQDLAFWGQTSERAIKSGTKLLMIENHLSKGYGIPSSAGEPGNVLAFVREHAAQNQKCMADVMLKIHEEIMTLRQSKSRKNQIRQLSEVLAVLSKTLSKCMEFSLKLEGGPPKRRLGYMSTESRPLARSFAPGSVVGPANSEPKAAATQTPKHPAASNDAKV